jgi:hypothetical protein
LWIPAPRADHIRATCRRIGFTLHAACAVLVPLLVLLGGRLPPVYPSLRFLSWALTATGVIMVLLAGTYLLLLARRHVAGEHLDFQEIGKLRSGIAAAWAWSLFTTIFACTGLALGISSAPLSSDARTHSWAAVWGFALLLTTPAVLTGVALAVSRRLFPPPSKR